MRRQVLIAPSRPVPALLTPSLEARCLLLICQFDRFRAIKYCHHYSFSPPRSSLSLSWDVEHCYRYLWRRTSRNDPKSPPPLSTVPLSYFLCRRELLPPSTAPSIEERLPELFPPLISSSSTALGLYCTAQSGDFFSMSHPVMLPLFYPPSGTSLSPSCDVGTVNAIHCAAQFLIAPSRTATAFSTPSLDHDCLLLICKFGLRRKSRNDSRSRLRYLLCRQALPCVAEKCYRLLSRRQPKTDSKRRSRHSGRRRELLSALMALPTTVTSLQ